jgi:RHH-type transcriptional regulator, proline utilization regulon repressor / proline dehydrogenase / delta 1-pyrroline-5-carboxylate dehydrogenase
MQSERMETIMNEAISLAEAWQDRANKLLTAQEKTLQARMMSLLTHPTDKVLLTKLIDQSFRSKNNRRVADQVSSLLREYGVPGFFSLSERLMARLFLEVGKYFPDWSVPKMIEKMREDSNRAIVPGEKEMLHAHLLKRKNEGVRMNINYLGEAVLGEEEARFRLEQYLEALKSPEIEYISVKISTIYSQINSLAFEHTVSVLEDRLARLYTAAQEHFFVRRDGTRVPKFVNLDMEEYRDLAITTAAFTRALERKELRNHSAGIVLQAYVPDSYGIQQELTEWARNRVADGGSPIKIRIVKGANMETEQVESSLHNWPLAPYDNKLDVDANYKRMVEFGMEPGNIKAVHLGIASHNLFDLAYAFKLAQHNGVTAYFSFEMLEGMADHVRRAIQETAGDMLLYAPVAGKEQFINAIAYLIRRLDENTSEENFLRYSCNLKTAICRGLQTQGEGGDCAPSGSESTTGGFSSENGYLLSRGIHQRTGHGLVSCRQQTLGRDRERRVEEEPCGLSPGDPSCGGGKGKILRPAGAGLHGPFPDKRPGMCGSFCHGERCGRG